VRSISGFYQKEAGYQEKRGLLESIQSMEQTISDSVAYQGAGVPHGAFERESDDLPTTKAPKVAAGRGHYNKLT